MPMKIRIAHVVEDMGMGGIERIIENIFLMHDHECFEHSFLCLSRGGEIYERIRSKGGDADILGVRSYHSIISIAKVASWLKRKRIHIVHVHGHAAGFLGRIAAFIAGNIGVIYHVHTTPLDLQRRQHLKESLLSLITDRVICVSRSVRDYLLAKQIFVKRRLTVVYNGVRVPGAEGGSISFDNTLLDRTKECYPVIGIVASLTLNKGHASLFHALKEILVNYPQAALLVVGDGPERDNLVKLAEALGVQSRVFFCGIQLNIFPYMQSMDIFVLPSIGREGLPCTIIEAMALGKPVVASNLHGIPEAVHEMVNGLLFTPGESKEMALSLLKLAGDRELSLTMGENGRRLYLAQFTFEQMMRNIEKLYLEVAGSRNVFV